MVHAFTLRNGTNGSLEKIVIRQADPSDWKALVELKRRSALANSGDRSNLLGHPEALTIPREHLVGGRVVGAMVAGSLRGFATIVPRPDGDAELEAVFVDPGVWRTGIGSALLDHCLMVARGMGARVLRVISNPHARAFYDALGFVKIGELDMPLGKGILMEKIIE